MWELGLQLGPQLGRKFDQLSWRRPLPGVLRIQCTALIRSARSLGGWWVNESGHLVLPRLRIVDESLFSFTSMSHDCVQITAMPWHITFAAPLPGSAAFTAIVVATQKRGPLWCLKRVL